MLKKHLYWSFKVDIWGPPNLDLLVNAMKNFVPHATMVKTHIIPQSDNVMVHGNGAALASSLHAEELQAEGKFKAVSISAILLTPTHLDGSHFSSNDTSIVYICNLHDIRGEFDPRKAKACGLKKGRKLGQLQNGISVKSDLLDIEVCSTLIRTTLYTSFLQFLCLVIKLQLTFILPHSGPSR